MPSEVHCVEFYPGVLLVSRSTNTIDIKTRHFAHSLFFFLLKGFSLVSLQPLSQQLQTGQRWCVTEMMQSIFHGFFLFLFSFSLKKSNMAASGWLPSFTHTGVKHGGYLEQNTRTLALEFSVKVCKIKFSSSSLWDFLLDIASVKDTVHNHVHTECR